MSCCEPRERLQGHPNVSFEDGQIEIYDRWGEKETFPDFDFCPWCDQPQGDQEAPEIPDRPEHLDRDPQGRLVARDWPSGPGSELTSLLLEQERRIEELQKPWDASSWISTRFSAGPLRHAARAGAAAQRGDLDEAEICLLRAKEEEVGLAIDDTGAVRPQPSLKGKPRGRPSEGFEPRDSLLKRGLRRLWPVATVHRQRKAERR